jgi:hypothetical protein
LASAFATAYLPSQVQNIVSRLGAQGADGQGESSDYGPHISLRTTNFNDFAKFSTPHRTDYAPSRHNCSQKENLPDTSPAD